MIIPDNVQDRLLYNGDLTTDSNYLIRAIGCLKLFPILQNNMIIKMQTTISKGEIKETVNNSIKLAPAILKI